MKASLKPNLCRINRQEQIEDKRPIKDNNLAKNCIKHNFFWKKALCISTVAVQIQPSESLIKFSCLLVKTMDRLLTEKKLSYLFYGQKVAKNRSVASLSMVKGEF
ncbi:MAG: hypothetical protein LAT67_03675 [Balneolales bacterium]|nr:hypothetical protein [Balneolales bacterium]